MDFRSILYPVSEIMEKAENAEGVSKAKMSTGCLGFISFTSCPENSFFLSSVFPSFRNILNKYCVPFRGKYAKSSELSDSVSLPQEATLEMTNAI